MRCPCSDPATLVRPPGLSGVRGYLVQAAFAGAQDARYALLRRAEEGGRETLAAVLVATSRGGPHGLYSAAM